MPSDDGDYDAQITPASLGYVPNEHTMLVPASWWRAAVRVNPNPDYKIYERAGPPSPKADAE